MRLSRAIAVFAVALAGVAPACGLAACGGGSKNEASAEAALEKATLEGIESGSLDVAFLLTPPTGNNDTVLATLNGRFQGEGPGRLPRLELKATAKGEFDGRKVDFEGGLTLLPHSAYVEYEGTEYEVDPTTFSLVEQMLRRVQGEAGVAGLVGCQEELGGLQFDELVENGKSKADVELFGGVQTTEVTGELDGARAIDSLVEVAESQGCRSRLATAGLFSSEAEIEKAKDAIGSFFKETYVEIYVGEDRIVHRMQVEGTVERPNPGSGPKKLHTGIDVKLNELNEPQRVSAPQNAKPLSGLFVKLGIKPEELLNALESGESLGGLLERVLGGDR